MLTCSREIGEDFIRKLVRSRAKKGLVRRNVLSLLHMRACQTTMEIIALLENGLADGAFARWRTLYEIGVIASLVSDHGDEIGQRYLDHDAVVMKKAMDNELRFSASDSVAPISKKAQKEINADFEAVVDEYGKEFSSNYGWAAHHLKLKNPTFQQLEEAVGQDKLPPPFKWASLKIHAGSSGMLRNLGIVGDTLRALPGASNAGLEEPAVNTAYSLTQITGLLYGRSNQIDTMIQLQALCELRDRVEKECSKSARKLLRDEQEIIDLR